MTTVKIRRAQELRAGLLTGFNRHAYGGFTLIELLVVIAIIALLMAILMPALQRVKKQANTAACQSKLHQWGLAFSMYATQNDGRMFAAFHGGGTQDSDVWGNALRPYYKEPDLRLCPTAMKAYDEGGSVTFGAYRRSRLQHHDDHVQHHNDHGLGSYGLSTWAGNAPLGMEAHYQYETKYQWRGFDVRDAGYIPLLVDAQWVDGWAMAVDEPPEYSGEPWQARGGHTGGLRRFCVNRHNGFTNGLFLDLSVRKIGLKELWELKWHRNWTEERANARTPVWPDWMRNLKDYN
ncbi:MAG: type II secretion system protein [Planctomycetota bacterium]